MVVLLFPIAGAPEASAQEVPVRTLSAPFAAASQGFTDIRAVRELTDQRLLVLDYVERSIVLLDPTLSEPVRIGGEGSGPNEYLLPSAFFDGRRYDRRSAPVFQWRSQVMRTEGSTAGRRAQAGSPWSRAGTGTPRGRTASRRCRFRRGRRS